MKLAVPGGPHLTYCTNIHPGETWAEVRANLERHVRAVKASVAPAQPFGVGLRLSAAAAATLAQPGELDAFREFLRDSGLYVFTINGFPYGPFHGTRVKEDVYLPDWLDEARLEYTDRLAELLAALLPDEPGLEGTVSTVPGAYKARVRGAADAARMAELMVRHAAGLHRLRERTGKTGVARARARALLSHGDGGRDRALLRDAPVRAACRDRVRPPDRARPRRERGRPPRPPRRVLRRVPHGSRVRGRRRQGSRRSAGRGSGSARCR